MVILNKSQLLGAKVIAERIRENIESLVITTEGGKTIKVTASLGASSSHDNASAAALMQQADQCLYRAKKEGRNRVEYYQENNENHIQRNLSIAE